MNISSFSNQNPTVLITGASRGIGQATAEAFLERGWNVIGTSTTVSSSSNRINHQNYKQITLQLDDENSIKNFIPELKSVASKVQCVVHNAAVFKESWTDPSIDLENLRQTFNVNYFGPVSLTEKLLENFKEIKNIIYVTSHWGTFSNPQFDALHPHYRQSKVALNMYVKQLAERLRNVAVVLAVSPGWVKTDMGGKDGERDPFEPAQEIFDLATKPFETGNMYYKGEKTGW